VEYLGQLFVVAVADSPDCTPGCTCAVARGAGREVLACPLEKFHRLRRERRFDRVEVVRSELRSGDGVHSDGGTGVQSGSFDKPRVRRRGRINPCAGNGRADEGPERFVDALDGLEQSGLRGHIGDVTGASRRLACGSNRVAGDTVRKFFVPAGRPFDEPSGPDEHRHCPRGVAALDAACRRHNGSRLPVGEGPDRRPTAGRRRRQIPVAPTAVPVEQESVPLDRRLAAARPTLPDPESGEWINHARPWSRFSA